MHLSQQQLCAIELLLQGLGDSQIGQQLGVNRATVYRWRTTHGVFRCELDRQRRQIWMQAADRMRAMIEPALNILQQQLDDPKTALRAAATVLRLAAPRNLQPPRPSDTRRQREELDELDDFIEAALTSEPV